jgi:uridine kinase
VMQHIRRRQPDVERYITPQRAHADIVITYSPSADEMLTLRTEVRTSAKRELLDVVLRAAERARCQAVSAASLPVEAR